MKIDAEGQEGQVIRGARRSLESKAIHCLVWERHPHWGSLRRLPSFIHEINEVCSEADRGFQS